MRSKMRSRMGLRNWPWTDIAVVIAIALILSGLLLPSNFELQRRKILKAIDDWTPPPEQPIGNPELFSPTATITGNWTSGYRHRSCIIIEATETPDVYVAHVSTAACTWNTKATRRGARLQLSEPVSDHFNHIFDALWIIEVNNETLLLPTCLVEDFNQKLNETDQNRFFLLFKQREE